MKHEAQLELLALRLYGELSAIEEEALEHHLELCEECAVHARELEETLGALRVGAADEHQGELPPDWSDRLRRMTTTRRAPSARIVATFATGLAAGLLLMWTLRPEAPQTLEAPEGPTITLATNAGEAPGFAARDTPPPRATSQTPLSQLPLLLRR